MKMMKSLSRGLTSLIADCSRIVVANLGGERIYRKAALARQPLGFCYWLKGRKHQEFSIGASSEVISARLKVRPEASRNYRNKGKRRFTDGLRYRLLSRRYAARYHNSAALSVENRFFNNFCNLAFACFSRNLYKHFIGSIQKKVVANGVAPFIIRERDRARHLEKLWVLHDSPATFNILANVGRHSFKLTFRKEDCIVKPREPECRRAVEKRGVFKRGVCFGAGDLKTSYNFAERRFKTLMNPDDAVEVLGHYGVLAGLDFREDLADLFPGRGNGDSEGRGNELAVFNIAENGAATLHDQGDHVKPGSAIIPTGQAYAGFEVAVFVAFAIHFVLPFFSFCAQGAQGRTPEYARHNPGRARRGSGRARGVK